MFVSTGILELRIIILFRSVLDFKTTYFGQIIVIYVAMPEDLQVMNDFSDRGGVKGLRLILYIEDTNKT